jgi:CheY-like chemotaxis protein
VITDIFMPGKDGLETIRDLKSDFPGVGIIAMSGASGRRTAADHLLTAQQVGADGVLRKPFEADALLAAVAQVLGRSE